MPLFRRLKCTWQRERSNFLIIFSWDVPITTQQKNIYTFSEFHRFSLCALNLFDTRVSQFELNYWNKWTFPRHSNLLRWTCSRKVCVELHFMVKHNIFLILRSRFWKGRLPSCKKKYTFANKRVFIKEITNWKNILNFECIIKGIVDSKLHSPSGYPTCIWVYQIHQIYQLRYCLAWHLTSIHNIAFSKEKVVSSEARVKYAQIKHYLEIKTVQKSFKQMSVN